MSTILMTTRAPGIEAFNCGRPRIDEVDAEMVEDQIDEEDDNPDDLDVDEAGFDNENADIDVETDKRGADDGPDGYVSEFD
jgi:hypothetical protein